MGKSYWRYCFWQWNYFVEDGQSLTASVNNASVIANGLATITGNSISTSQGNVTTQSLATITITR